jgi:alpha-glucosidase
MQQAFNFIYMTAGWDAVAMHTAIDDSLATNAAVDATTTWVLSNHDVVRHASRFGLADPTSWPRGIGAKEEQPDAALGLTRARAATLLMLALPGSAYLFEGEELGLPEHTTLPDEVRQDPSFFRTKGAQTGRDGARVPLPWVADAPGYGFATAGSGTGAGANAAAAAAPWLPQPESFRDLAVDRQDGVAGSTLEFYRSAIALRRSLGLGAGSLSWLESDPSVLAFENSGVRVVLNFGPRPAQLPKGADILLASSPDAIRSDALGASHAVWLRV